MVRKQISIRQLVRGRLFSTLFLFCFCSLVLLLFKEERRNKSQNKINDIFLKLQENFNIHKASNTEELNKNNLKLDEQIRDFKVDDFEDIESLRCKDIFSIRQASTRLAFNREVVERIRNIVKAKTERKLFLDQNNYYELRDYIASKLETNSSHGLLNTSISVKKVDRLSEMNGQLPFLPCRLRIYKPSEVQKCLQRKEKSGRTLNLYFIGDSRVRTTMEALFMLLEEFDWAVETSNETISMEEFLSTECHNRWTKYKDILTATTSDMPNLKIKFVWAPFLSRTRSGAWRTVKRSYTVHYFKNKLAPDLNNKTNVHESPSSQSTNHSTEQNSKSSKFSDVEGIQEHMRTNDVDKSHQEKSIPSFQNVSTEKHRNHSSSQGDGRKRREFCRVSKNEKVLWDKVTGGLDEFEKLDKMKEEDLPNMIFISTGAWDIMRIYFDPTTHLDEATVSTFSTLNPYLKSLARKTSVVWLAPEEMKDFLAMESGKKRLTNYYYNNNMQEWLLNSQLQLVPPSVQVWDSYVPVASALLKDCYLLALNGLINSVVTDVDKEKYWKCGDRTHSGYEGQATAAQMILNQACNYELDPEGFCCEKS